MNIETSKRNPNLIEPRSPEEIQSNLDYIREEMSESGLSSHYIRNAIISADVCRVMSDISNLQPLETYEARIRREESGVGYPEEVVEEWIRCSDSDAVKEYDELITRFNADIKKIKKENDVANVSTFVENVLALLKRHNA